MPRAVISIFAVLVSAYPTVASESCLNGQCHDEVSLMQAKTSVSRPQENNMDTISHRLFRVDDPMLLELLGSTTETTTCLGKEAFSGHGNYPACKTAAGGNFPCQKCIEDQWAHGTGAGYQCCNALAEAKDADDLKQVPLCGICLRWKGGGLKGVKADKKDQSDFETCAASYCQLADKQGSAITDALLQKVATDCSPAGTKNPTTPEEGMVALVANNPKKEALKSFLEGKADTINAVTQSITGTASSSTMAMCVTKAQKAAFSTFSGPWGGDAQLAGLMAAQCLGGKKYLKAVVFFSDENEAHRMDILALKHLMSKCASHFHIAFDAASATKLLDKLPKN
jgi:methylglyoxal synthase